MHDNATILHHLHAPDNRGLRGGDCYRFRNGQQQATTCVYVAARTPGEVDVGGRITNQCGMSLNGRFPSNCTQPPTTIGPPSGRRTVL